MKHFLPSSVMLTPLLCATMMKMTTRVKTLKHIRKRMV